MSVSANTDKGWKREEEEREREREMQLMNRIRDFSIKRSGMISLLLLLLPTTRGKGAFVVRIRPGSTVEQQVHICT